MTPTVPSRYALGRSATAAPACFSSGISSAAGVALRGLRQRRVARGTGRSSRPGCGRSRATNSACGRCVSTMAPRSCPAIASICGAVLSPTYTARPLTTPAVDGDHASAYAMSGTYRGSVIATDSCSSCQPRPNSYGSRCGLARPHSAKRSSAQRAACMCAGDPVSRAPMSSVSVRYRASARERCWPSALMRATMSAASRCCPEISATPSSTERKARHTRRCMDHSPVRARGSVCRWSCRTDSQRDSERHVAGRRRPGCPTVAIEVQDLAVCKHSDFAPQA